MHRYSVLPSAIVSLHWPPYVNVWSEIFLPPSTSITHTNNVCVRALTHTLIQRWRRFGENVYDTRSWSTAVLHIQSRVLSHQVNWYFWAATVAVRQSVRHTATLYDTTSTLSAIVHRKSCRLDCKWFLIQAVPNLTFRLLMSNIFDVPHR